jgi:hypothetical protein
MRIIERPHRALILAALAVAALAASVQAAPLVIVSDGFSGVDGTGVNGRTPDGANLPGAAWFATGVAANNPPVIAAGTGNPLPSVDLKYNGDASISIASAGAYVKPHQMIISGDLNLNNTLDDNDLARGVGLGFYSVATPTPPDAPLHFTGLTLSNAGSNNGALSVIVDGSSLGSIPVLSGILNTASFYRLFYTVDTTTGAVSNVSLNGSAIVGLPATTGFTDSATTLAGFYTSSAASDTHGHVDNFSVITPEPASSGLVGIACVASLCRWSRRRSCR